MKDKVFGLSAKFLPRRWCKPDRLVIGPEELPQEAKVILTRSDGNRRLMLSYGAGWLSDEATLEIQVKALGGIWSPEEADWLRHVLEPMVTG